MLLKSMIKLILNIFVLERKIAKDQCSQSKIKSEYD